MEILFFAVVAALVLGRLYQVLGQNRGAEPPPIRERRVEPPQPVERRGFEVVPDGTEDAGVPDVARTEARNADTTALGAGIAAIRAKDRSFDPDLFLNGARSAYEMIVTAFGRGDEDTLRGLLTPDVFAAYSAAIAQRRADGAKLIEVVRLSDATLKAAELDGTIARVDVHFSADLQDGGDGLRPTDEVWTFERDVTSRAPDWLLSAVETA